MSIAATQCLNSDDEYVRVKALLLDVPFIFDQMMDGAEKHCLVQVKSGDWK